MNFLTSPTIATSALLPDLSSCFRALTLAHGPEVCQNPSAILLDIRLKLLGPRLPFDCA